MGVDGEGYDRESDGRHVYNMLRAGGWFLAPDDGADHLSTRECLDFLSELPPTAIYVAYFFDYDVTKILEDLGWNRLARLLDREARTPKKGESGGRPFPVDVLDDEFQIDYMPRKYFKVRKRLRVEIGENGKEKNVYTKWVTINDVGPFFQCRFVQALSLWDIGTNQERSLVESGKSQRNSHRSEDFARIKTYNALECKLLAELMEQFREACIDVGYVPRQWQGPGQIAEAMLRQNGIPRTRDVPLFAMEQGYSSLFAFARNAFYGGRPEITAVGEIPFSVDQWDINSAYPYALTNVPCLEHGGWRHEKVGTGNRIRILSGELAGLAIQPTAIYYGSFDFNGEGKPPNLYGLPVRSESGTISYPKAGRGWYWGFEILASVHQTFNAVEGWEYVENCRCVPFGWVRKVYAVRKSMGKDARGIVLKLALNSLYGKMAQSIGNPKYSNPIWASFITAFCRAQIQELLHKSHGLVDKCGQGVWMIATDAIFTSLQLPIKDSDSLGGFSKEIHPKGIFLVQPGLYFRGNGGKPKTRGVPQTLVIQHEQDFRKNFQRMERTNRIEEGDVVLSLRSFVGIRQALHRHNMDILGQWVETTKRISFDWKNKRHPGFVNKSFGHDFINLTPPRGSRLIESVPYSKDIGRMLDLRNLDLQDQPDWVTKVTGMDET